MEISQILTGYVIPLGAIALSVAFWLSGRASAKEAKKTLEEIQNTTREWQNDIMQSAIDMLGSKTEIVGKQVVLEEAKVKTEAIKNLSAAIEFAAREVSSNPKTGEEAQAQIRNLELLLGALLEHIGRAKDKNFPFQMPPIPQEQNENACAGPPNK